MSPKKNLFITVEGVDGAGKTTQTTMLEARLTRMGYDVVRTREPGGSPLAEDIRRFVVEGDPDRMDATTELLLFTAARRDHVQRTILPALAQGKIVLCDRYVDSTHALQGAAGIPAATIDALHNAHIGLDPDLVLFFDIDAQTALERAVARMGAEAVEGRMERKGAAFHEAVGAILRARSTLPGRLRIDARGCPTSVAARVDAALLPHLPPL